MGAHGHVSMEYLHYQKYSDAYRHLAIELAQRGSPGGSSVWEAEAALSRFAGGAIDVLVLVPAPVGCRVHTLCHTTPAQRRREGLDEGAADVAGGHLGGDEVRQRLLKIQQARQRDAVAAVLVGGQLRHRRRRRTRGCVFTRGACVGLFLLVADSDFPCPPRFPAQPARPDCV